MKYEYQLTRFLNSRVFALTVLRHVEENVGHCFQAFRGLDPTLLTLNDYASSVETCPTQKSAWLSIQFAYVFEQAITRALKDKGFAVLDKRSLEGEQKSDFGVRVTERGKPKDIYFEVKTTRAKDRYSGSTHSEAAGKVDRYVLVNYEIDTSAALPPLSQGGSFSGVITKVHFAVLHGQLGWSGRATENNSFTSAQIPKGVGPEYQVLLGSLLPHRKWCGLTRESLADFRYTTTGGIRIK